MSKVIFIRPRHDYHSYRDLYRLIELSGYPLRFPDEVDRDSDNLYILTILNGETEHGWPGARAKIILWDFEWHMDGLPTIPGVDELWSPDAWYAGCIGARYVPLGGDARLNPEPDAARNKQYDVALLSYMVNRRQEVAFEMQGRGLSLAPNGWFQERHETLLATRAIAHIHQHGHIPAVAAQRFVLAAAYGLPLFTETLADAGIFDPHHLLTSDKAHYAEFAAMWLKEPTQRLRDIGAALRHLLTVEYAFQKVIEGAV